LDYKKALEENDYKGILSFLSALRRGNHLRNDFIEVIVKLTLAVDPLLITINISKYSPILIEQIIAYLNPNQVLEIFAAFKDSSPLPLFIGLLHIINPAGNNSFDNALLNNNMFIKDASGLVASISTRVVSDNLYKHITDCSNIFLNKLWHSIFSAYIADKPTHFDEYVNEINFSYDTGVMFYNTFSEHSGEANLDAFSLKVYDKYLNHLILDNGLQQHLFCFTSYYNFLLRAVCALSNNSFSGYLTKLEHVSIELKRGIYSWDQNKRCMLFTNWVYWILASKQIEHNSKIVESEMETTYDLMNDNRITSVLNCGIGTDKTGFSKLLNIFENPDSIDNIVLPHGNETITISWSKRKES
jgi:hypothetical protein